MSKQSGFSLIELIMFIIVSSILASAILIAYVGTVQSPALWQNTVATATARQCADWYLMRRRDVGYASVSGSNCTSTLSLPSVCTVPSGYTITGTCTSTTIGSDNNYILITLTVNGPSRASLNLLLGDY